MPNHEPKIGRDYLTCSGLPVRVVGLGQEHMALQSLASDNLMRVPHHYPLVRLRSKQAVAALQPQPYRPHGPKLRARLYWLRKRGHHPTAIKVARTTVQRDRGSR